MRLALFFLTGLYSVLPALAQRSGVSVTEFLQVKNMNLGQATSWLHNHHFVLLKDEIRNQTQQMTYLSNQADAAGDHDAFFIAYKNIHTYPQYINYSTNVSRFMQFKRALPTHQFQLIDAFEDMQGNQILQFRNKSHTIELTTVWSARLKNKLYTIALLPASKRSAN